MVSISGAPRMCHSSYLGQNLPKNRFLMRNGTRILCFLAPFWAPFWWKIRKKWLPKIIKKTIPKKWGTCNQKAPKISSKIDKKTLRNRTWHHTSKKIDLGPNFAHFKGARTLNLRGRRRVCSMLPLFEKDHFLDPWIPFHLFGSIWARNGGTKIRDGGTKIRDGAHFGAL